MKYKKLDNTVEIKGTGIKGLTSELIDSTKNIYLFKRSDNVYETFIAFQRDETEIFGRKYPPMDVYPSNEDFGSSAWCIRDPERAKRKYQQLVKENA